MAKLFMYSIFDKNANTYTLPFCAPNDEAACRSIALAMLNDMELKFFADDYFLVKVGDFDSICGAISGASDLDSASICTLRAVMDRFPFVQDEKVLPDENVL